MTKKTNAFLRKMYKGLLLAGLSVIAFVLRFHNENPQPGSFDVNVDPEKASADVYPDSPYAPDAPDCPPGGPGDGPCPS